MEMLPFRLSRHIATEVTNQEVLLLMIVAGTGITFLIFIIFYFLIRKLKNSTKNNSVVEENNSSPGFVNARIINEKEESKYRQDENETVLRLTTKDKRNRFDRWFELMLEEGGSKISPTVAMLIVMGVMLITMELVFVIFENVPLAIGTGILCMTIPMTYWNLHRSWRLRKMKRLIPESLEMVGDAIRSGMSLEDSLEMVALHIETPLKSEFIYANRQLQAGQSPMLVMNRMARRVPITEFRLFTTAVLVHRATGGNLAEMANRLARSARERLEFQGHLNAITAGNRMSVIGMVIVTVTTVTILCGLDYTYLYRFIMNPYGPFLLGLTVILFVVGWFWTWSIMRVNY